MNRIHKQVYDEIRTWPNAKALMGESGVPEQDASRKARAEHAGYFAEFLPFFAIRPAYTTLLFLLSPLGFTRAAVLISVVSYFLVGWLLVVWIDTPWLWLLVMLSGPMFAMGRNTISDCFALLISLLGLFFIFQRKHLLPGLALLLVSIFARTDNVFLVAPVLAVLWLTSQIEWWQAGVLGLVAVLAVLVINHFAGDYGIQMLYYRNFVRQPIAAAETTVHFSLHQYLTAFRTGISVMLNSAMIPFAILGAIGFRRDWRLPVIAAVYAILHYLALPNYQERWFVICYLLFAIAGFEAVTTTMRGESSDEKSTDLKIRQIPMLNRTGSGLVSTSRR